MSLMIFAFVVFLNFIVNLVEFFVDIVNLIDSLKVSVCIGFPLRAYSQYPVHLVPASLKTTLYCHSNMNLRVLLDGVECHVRLAYQ